jgi:hypothetical protein
VKEIIDSNARDMIVRHLGKRLGIFTEPGFAYEWAKTRGWQDEVRSLAQQGKEFHGDPPVWGL